MKCQNDHGKQFQALVYQTVIKQARREFQICILLDPPVFLGGYLSSLERTLRTDESGRLRIDNLIVQSPRDRECDRAMAPDGGI